MRHLRGKKALITGAASGIGRAIALRLAREGCDLYLLDIDLPGVLATAAAAGQFGVDAVGVRCDVGQREDVRRANAAMLQRWGYLDILVNNAGVAYHGPSQTMTEAQWDWMLSINLLAPIQFVRELLPVLRDRPESHIVNIASIFGLVAHGRSAAYNVSKFGLVGLGAALRAEFGRQGVGVSTICPGFVDTNLLHSAPCGHGAGRQTPPPPRILSTSPDRVAAKVVRAIRRNQRLVVVTAFAHVLYFASRYFPGLLDWLQHLGLRRRRAKTARTARQAARGSHGTMPDDQGAVRLT